MNPRIAALCVWVLLSVLIVPQTALAEEIVIPGSGNPEFVLGEMAKAFNARQSAVRVRIPPSTGSAGAIRALDERTSAITRIGRPLKDAERRPGLDYVPIGVDPVVFIAGAGVSVKAVTASQALEIYTGKLTDWRELGGKPGPIRAIGRETTDASRQAIDREFKIFVGIAYGDGVKVVHLDPDMLAALDRYPTSFGFLNRSALGAARTPVVPLMLDGVAPTADNMASRRYPLRTEFGFVVRKADLSDGARQFMAFVASPEGEAILLAHGALPVNRQR